MLWIWSCGDNPSSSEPGPRPPDNPNLASKDIGPGGGEISSKDGKLTLIIPDGALPGTETITIEQLTPDELGSQFDSIDVENAWELGPDGLQFARPITLEFETNQNPVPDDTTLSLAPERLLVSNGTTVEPLDSLTLKANAANSTVMVSGRLTHFSRLVDDKLKDYNIFFYVNRVPDKIVYNGEGFLAIATISDKQSRITNTPPVYDDNSINPLMLNADNSKVPFRSEIFGYQTNGLHYICNGIGSGKLSALTFLKGDPFTDGIGLTFVKSVDCVEGGFIEGRVTINNDGVPGIIVRIFDDQAQANTSTGEFQSTETDDSGNYRFENVLPTSIDVIISVPEGIECPEGMEKTVNVESNETSIANFECFTQESETAPIITDLNTNQIGVRTFKFNIKGSYTGNLDDHSGVFVPNDGSSQEVGLPLQDDENGDNQFIAETDYTFPMDAMLPTESIIKVTNYVTDESDSKEILIEEVTLTVKKDGDGKGTVKADDPYGILDYIINCNPDCEETAVTLPIIGTAVGNIILQAIPDKETDSQFIEWSNNCAQDPECRIFLGKQDYTITATFERKPLPFVADLSLHLTPPDTPVLQFENTPVKININNNGPDKAEQTSIMLEMSNGQITKTPENIDCEDTPAQQVECTIGDMEAGTEQELNYVIVVEETGEVVATGTLSSAADDPDENNNTDQATITVKEQDTGGSACASPFDLNGDQVLGLRAFTTDIAGFVITFVDAVCAGSTTLQLTEIDSETPAVDITCDTETGDCGTNNIINGKAHTCSIETTFGNRSFYFDCFEGTEPGDKRITAQMPLGTKPSQLQIVEGSRYQYGPTIAQVGNRPGCNATFTDSDRDVGLDVISPNGELAAYLGQYSEDNTDLLFKGNYNADNGYWDATNTLPFGAGTVERIIKGVWTLATDEAIDFTGSLSVKFYNAQDEIECEYQGGAWITNRN